LPHGSLHLVLAKNGSKSTELTVQALPQRDRNMRALTVESRCVLASERSLGRLLFCLIPVIEKKKESCSWRVARKRQGKEERKNICGEFVPAIRHGGESARESTCDSKTQEPFLVARSPEILGRIFFLPPRESAETKRLRLSI
jgi:hypothetical protein